MGMTFCGHIFQRLIALLLVSSVRRGGSLTQAWVCYTPEGEPIQDTIYATSTWQEYTPCNTDYSIPSTCCPNGSYCGNDNLCRTSNGGIFRQYCTLATWDTLYCNHLCMQFRDAGVQLISCPNGSFCCGFNNTACCDAGQGTFINQFGQILLPDGAVSSIPGISSATVAAVTKTVTVPASATSSTSSTSTSTDSSTTSSLSQVRVATVTMTMTMAMSTTTDTTDPAQTAKDGRAVPVGAIAGAAAGGVALLALVGLLVWLRRRRTAKAERKKERARQLMRTPTLYRDYYGGRDTSSWPYEKPARSYTHTTVRSPMLHELDATRSIRELEGSVQSSHDDGDDDEIEGVRSPESALSR